MRDLLENIYSVTKIKNYDFILRQNKVIISFNDGAKVEILGDDKRTYRIEFINQDNGVTEYSTYITNNQWCKSNKKYFVNWLIEVYSDDVLLHSEYLNLNNKHVLINLDTSALGDTIAWIPIVEEFRKKHGCNLHVYSNTNKSIYEETYPHINFIKSFDLACEYFATYRIGLYYKEGDQINYDLNPCDPRKISLQNIAASILGLEPMEIKPNMVFNETPTTINSKYVVIAPHATAHAKYWNYPNGWQIVIDHIKSIGYEVVMITKEPLHTPHDLKLGGTLAGVVDKTGDLPLEDRVNDIKNATLFIGLGSGLSWLSWALGTKTMVISGFSEPYTEFQDCIRISTPHAFTCSGCFNTHRLDAADWDWCPSFKNTSRMFECTKTITPDMVINEINKVLL